MIFQTISMYALWNVVVFSAWKRWKSACFDETCAQNSCIGNDDFVKVAYFDLRLKEYCEW